MEWEDTSWVEYSHLLNGGTKTRQRCLMLFSSLSSTLMRDREGVRALSWWTMTVKIINSQLVLNFRRDLLLHLDPYKALGSGVIHLRMLKELLMSSRTCLKGVWMVLGILRIDKVLGRSHLAGGWLTQPQFSKTAVRKTTETTVLSVSLLCLVQLRGKLFWEFLRNIWKILQSLVIASLASWEEDPAYQTCFLFIKFNPTSRSRGSQLM